MLGYEYIREHIRQVYRREEQEKLYKEYITDALYSISRASDGARMVKRYSEILTEIYAPKLDHEEEEKAAEKVKANIVGKLNGRRKGVRTGGSI